MASQESFIANEQVQASQMSTEDKPLEQRPSSQGTETTYLPSKGRKRTLKKEDMASDAPIEPPLKRLLPLLRGPSGEQVVGPLGEQVAGSSGEQVAGSSGEQVVGPSGEQIAGPSGEQVAGPFGEQVAESSGEQVFDRAIWLGMPDNGHINHWTEQRTWPAEPPRQDMITSTMRKQSSAIAYHQRRTRLGSFYKILPNDQLTRAQKTAPYREHSFPMWLEESGQSYMIENEPGLTIDGNLFCVYLPWTRCLIPTDNLFFDEVFPTACRNLRDRNEAKIIQDFGRLLVPSPETFARYGYTGVSVFAESVNEAWTKSIPITVAYPQPDFAVGFGRSAFSDDQLRKLRPLLGDASCSSFFKATHYMYFPFLTCEVLCHGLEIADRQNAHSMTLAVRGIVELFRLAKRERELQRVPLTFSVSHDHQTVKLYGYYPVIEGSRTRIYRHAIEAFDFTDHNGKDRWKTYQFTAGVYQYGGRLFRRMLSVIDELPLLLGPEVAQLPEPRVGGAFGDSQQLGSETTTAPR